MVIEILKNLAQVLKAILKAFVEVIWEVLKRK
jgi:hypothetical protein